MGMNVMSLTHTHTIVYPSPSHLDLCVLCLVGTSIVGSIFRTVSSKIVRV